MSESKEELIISGVKVTYEGTPTIEVAIDGSFLNMDIGTPATSITLPNHTTRRTRTVSLPASSIGYIPQFYMTTDVDSAIRWQWMTHSRKEFEDQLLWHYFEVTYKGDINVIGYLDGSEVIASKNLVTVDTQKTEKIYFPAMSFGYVPHLWQDPTDSNGELISFKPVALKPEVYSKLRHSKRAWITYTGSVTFQWYVDGTAQLGSGKVLTAATSPAYRTENIWLPSNVRGNVFQWAQTGGTGDIYTVETDETLENLMQPPTVEKKRG